MKYIKLICFKLEDEKGLAGWLNEERVSGIQNGTQFLSKEQILCCTLEV